MKPIISNDRIYTLGPHPEEAALLRGRLEGWPHGHGLACGRPSRRARKRALLRTRVKDGIDMIRTMESLY
jgi:hypothetical protein